ncbi:MAG: polyphosphate kinase 1 [Caldilineaceae bacterium]
MAMFPKTYNGMPEQTILPVEPAYLPDVDISTLPVDELSSSEQVYNRELSWLDFNWRVLHEAMDERTPLLERVNYLAISASNLDEFFRKRVGGLKRQKASGASMPGWSPEFQLQLIARSVRLMVETQSKCLLENIIPQLAIHGVHILNYADFDDAEKEDLQRYYQTEIFPLLMPMVVDPGHRFPFISDQSLYLSVTLLDPVIGESRIAIVEVPANRPRWLPVADRLHFVALEQLITHNLNTLFVGEEIIAVHPFRISRNVDIERNEYEADDLLDMISEELRERRFAPVIRLEVNESMSESMFNLLRYEFYLDYNDVYRIHGFLGLNSLLALADLDLPYLKYKPWTPLTPARLTGLDIRSRPRDFFSVIRQGDLMIHHPYYSFATTTQQFIEAAVRDPYVLAIKQTIYRTSANSPIIRALIQAAELGKLVAVLVEVKAPLEEMHNLEWARMLENAGCHVVYGVVGLKIHAKLSLAIREEDDGLRAYYHIGTGNYNAKTATFYTDLGLFSCSPELGADLMDLFNFLTGYSRQIEYRKLLVAPFNMRQRFIEMIDCEIGFALAGKGGRIIAKMNGLEDPPIVRKLYEASQAGVSIDLIIRGNCRLRPGLTGISENIRVISIVGRFFEHSRIYYFENDGEPLYFIGSADWTSYNLSEQIEVIVRIDDPRLCEQLNQILLMSLNDFSDAWEMLPDGRYLKRQPLKGETVIEAEQGLQSRLMDITRIMATTRTYIG